MIAAGSAKWTQDTVHRRKIPAPSTNFQGLFTPHGAIRNSKHRMNAIVFGPLSGRPDLSNAALLGTVNSSLRRIRTALDEIFPTPPFSALAFHSSWSIQSSKIRKISAGGSVIWCRVRYTYYHSISGGVPPPDGSQGDAELPRFFAAVVCGVHM